MHSSRMRTACLSPVSPSMHCSGGVPAWSRGCTCLVLGGCTCLVLGDTCLVWGVYLPGLGGVPAWSQGTVTAWSHWGVPAWSGGVYLPRYSLPLWTEFLTHASENITLPQTSFAGGKNQGILTTEDGDFILYFQCCRTMHKQGLIIGVECLTLFAGYFTIFFMIMMGKSLRKAEKKTFLRFSPCSKNNKVNG